MLFNGSVAALVWMDKRTIYFVTSIYVSSPPVYVMRCGPGEHRRVAIPAPKAVKAYNDYMGGTDRNDQMTKLQTYRRHYKWPSRLTMKFFLWAAYDAYVQMILSNRIAQQERDHLHFIFLLRGCVSNLWELSKYTVCIWEAHFRDFIG